MRFEGKTVRSMVDKDNPRNFAPWVRALRGKSGVYLIVEAQRAQYVGVSYSNKLYGTLTRHVQNWSRGRSDAYTGPVFDRHAILVGVESTEEPAEAQRRERDWIHRFGPLLNRQELPFETKRMSGDALTDEEIAYVITGEPVIEDEIDALAFFESLAAGR